MADVDKMLRNLGVIAAVKQNDKLLTQGEFFAIYMPTQLRSLYRSYYRESREQNMERVAECIRSAKVFVTTTMSEQSAMVTDTNETVAMRMHRISLSRLCNRVLAALTEAIVGLENLQQTYFDDAALLVITNQLKSDILDFVESASTVSESFSAVARIT